ncbi:hypothetical protein OSTOST_23673, partial [Ostertagia ostertagi]
MNPQPLSFLVMQAMILGCATVMSPSAFAFSQEVYHKGPVPLVLKRGSAMCSMCRGKIWLKSASRCHRCLVVCHHKCVEKAASGIPCTPHAITQGDTEFAEVITLPLIVIMVFFAPQKHLSFATTELLAFEDYSPQLRQ